MSNLNIPAHQIEAVMNYDGKKFIIANLDNNTASWLLQANTRNRLQRDRHIMNYTSMMENGQWKFTGDPIRFHADGHLIDGQHRLAAISQLPSGSHVKVLLITGFTDDEMLFIDQGAKRTAGDQLTIGRNVPNSTYIASVAKQTLVIEGGLLFNDRKEHDKYTSLPRILSWYDDHQEDCEFLQRIRQDVISCGLSPKVVGAFALMAKEFDAEVAEEFISKLRSGAELETGSPILALRNRVIRNKMNRIKESERDQLGLLIKTWNAWLEGASMSKVALPKGGTFTRDTFPEIYVGD